jgi:hypothetical protein
MSTVRRVSYIDCVGVFHQGQLVGHQKSEFRGPLEAEDSRLCSRRRATPHLVRSGR